jgi:hypothetical protein
MGRAVRSVLLALAVMSLSAAPGSSPSNDGASAPRLAAAPSVVVSDPSQQLASALPVVRGAARSAVLDSGSGCDRVDARTRLVPVAVVPVSPLVGTVESSVRADDRVAVGAAGSATRRCSRAPPSGRSMTSM